MRHYPRPSDGPRRRSYTHVVRPRITRLKYLFVLGWISEKLWITKTIKRSSKCNNIMYPKQIEVRGNSFGT